MNATDKRRYAILDGQDHDVMGGPLPRGNAYLTAYLEYDEGEVTTVDDLAVGESLWATYRLSGSKGRYRILRLQ